MTLEAFLACTEVIDWQSPSILALSAQFQAGAADEIDYVRRAFEFVRDEILHSGDHQLDPVTCSASETLFRKTGFCYSKSHLLAALYRAAKIPAGFGYQRLSFDGEGSAFCLHGFVVVQLEPSTWRRLDPRGNRPDLTTCFSATADVLAFTPALSGEKTFPAILSKPLPVVVEALHRYRSRLDLLANLPDQTEVSGAL
jgi:transglutaminase-like putative cysteine protease